MSTRQIPILTNVVAADALTEPDRIIDAPTIRAALERAGIPIGPDPGKDGDWAADVVIDGETHAIVAFGRRVKSVSRGTLSASRPVWIEDGRMVVGEP